MLSINEIIRRIYKDLVCPVCGKKYEAGKISVKSFVEKTLVLSTTCPEQHTSLFITRFNQINEIKAEPITADDCIDLHLRLTKFKGDFQKIWKK